MNFFDPLCQEPPSNVGVFGLCDDQNGRKAYSDTTNQNNWIATVLNTKNVSLVFTAIDKCVIHDNEYEGRGRCDGMLTSNEHLFFVELKDQHASWINHAIGQLESTIQFFISVHGQPRQIHKKAFACNRSHRHFQEIDHELNLRFRRLYGFRIDVQASILII
jgi:hypothetical protein